MAEPNQPLEARPGLAGLVDRFKVLPPNRKIAILGAAAAVLALIIALTLSGRDPGYKILFSNLAEKDGGAVTAALQQANVPYRVEAGGVIAVPADQVYDVRLRLAAQGLPKGGTVGFEMLDNQKFGLTQFAEQVNYQRAIEGELARSVESIQSVDSARVHLAIPKSSVFVRDQEKPTASVVLNLYAGRVIDQAQVAAIVHLVASSVPELNPKNVTVVDQQGNLLTNNSEVTAAGLNSSQLAYLRRIEADFVKRIETILKPIVGNDNVRAEVTAELDFSQNEQTAETYRPNPEPKDAAVRSRQSVETLNTEGSAPAGVPGAMSNQPPGAATAPITLANNPGNQANRSATITNPNSSHREATTNYEVDKTIRHTKEAVGSIKRLSAAVVVNYKVIYEKGELRHVPLTPAEMGQINGLVKEAMGFNVPRGDTVNVVNASFAGTEQPVRKSLMDLLMEILTGLGEWIRTNPGDFLKYLFLSVLTMYVLFFIVRPVIKKLTHVDKSLPATPSQAEVEQGEGGIHIIEGDNEPLGEPAHELTPEEREQQIRMASYADNLEAVRALTRDDPRIIAQIIRGWIDDSNNGIKEKR